jgi:hypothetical protein
MKYQALRRVLSKASPDLKRGLAYGAGGALAGGALGAGAYDLATPDTFLERLGETSSDAIESIGEHIEDNPDSWLANLSLLGGSALGSALEQRNARERAMKVRGYYGE